MIQSIFYSFWFCMVALYITSIVISIRYHSKKMPTLEERYEYEDMRDLAFILRVVIVQLSLSVGVLLTLLFKIIG